MSDEGGLAGRWLIPADAGGRGTAMATEKNAYHGSRRLYSALEAASMLGVGRTYMFHLIATGQIESVKIGKLRKIPSDALEEYIDRLRAEQASRR